MKEKSKFKDPEYYYNRELSWVRFNYRVLTEAQDSRIPLLERFNFLSITASNLDEFFMVRVASLKDMVHAKYTKTDIAGMTPQQQLDALSVQTHELIEEQYRTLNESLVPELERCGIHVLIHHEDLNADQAAYVDNYFNAEVYPVLTPLAVDSSRPFPLVRNKSLNICALLKPKDDDSQSGKFRDLYFTHKKKKKDSILPPGIDFATVQVPGGMNRLVEIPSENENELTFILLEQVIERNISRLFVNNTVICAFPYRLMRNADLSIEEDEAADLLLEIEKQLKRRQRGEAIRLEIEKGMDERLVQVLTHELNINKPDIFEIDGPLDLTFVSKLNDIPGYETLKEKPYTPQPPKFLNMNDSIFHQIRMHDVLLHHPYETFDPVVNLVKRAARDDRVLAIKQTLYRVSSNSPIIASLAEAAQNGKQVTVLVELKARFDEENNIIWARKLEQAGCHVLYGLVGLKTHSKITLVVRHEDDGIRRYVHLGTGNYNDKTAKHYTDLGLMTCNKLIGEDATAVFNMLSGYSEPAVWNKLAIAPIWLRDKFYELIRRETRYAKKGKPAFIRAKMNSLCDQGIIAELYRASAAGVKIDLLVRGICCLKVGIPGVSENIHVRSIVGKFLEHSRIFHFYNNGNDEVYMGSADWMPRNLDRRVEIIFPVEDETLKAEVKGILDVEFKDNLKAHVLQPDGTYKKLYPENGEKPVNSQNVFMKRALKNASSSLSPHKGYPRRFEPLEAPAEDGQG